MLGKGFILFHHYLITLKHLSLSVLNLNYYEFQRPLKPSVQLMLAFRNFDELGLWH
jgi:hypothetical protein